MARLLIMFILMNLYTPVYGGGLGHGEIQSSMGQVAVGSSHIAGSLQNELNHDCCPSQNKMIEHRQAEAQSVGFDADVRELSLVKTDCFDCQGECGDCQNLSQPSSLFGDVAYALSLFNFTHFDALLSKTLPAFKSFDRPPI